MEVKDSNGNVLMEGDSVTVIKDLKVRGSSTVIKRGTKVKNIRLTKDEAEIEGKVEGSVMVLRTEFLKMAWSFLETFLAEGINLVFIGQKQAENWIYSILKIINKQYTSGSVVQPLSLWQNFVWLPILYNIFKE